MKNRDEALLEMPDGSRKLAFCGLQIRPLDTKKARQTVSDGCDQIATSYFESDSGRILFRCDEHKNKKRNHLPHPPHI